MEESNCERDHQAHVQEDSASDYRCVPVLRFRGFTYAWERQRLGELIFECTQRTSDFAQYPLHSLTIENGVTEKTERYERGFLVTKEEDLFKIVPPKYFVTNPMNLRFGAIGCNQKSYNVSVSGYYDVFSIDDRKCSEFWLAYLKTHTALKKYDDVATGSLIEKRRVHFSELKKIDFLAPADSEEKQKIGDYFENLDRLVALHQRKLTKLHTIKKALLEKMFPTPGSTIPEIRFRGFTETWELHKVGDFLTESQIRGNTGLEAKKLTVKLRGKGVVEKNDVGGSEHTRYFIRRKGQFIYSKLDFLNAAFGVIPENLDTYESTADLPAFDLDGMNPYFMLFTATQKNFYLKHGSIADGSRKAKRIHTDTFLNMPITVPTIDEQNFVVSCFQYLDSLATLHQHKLNKLHCIKKALLEKMFV